MRVESHVASSGSGDHAANHLSPAPVLQVAALPSPPPPPPTLTGPPCQYEDQPTMVHPLGTS